MRLAELVMAVVMAVFSLYLMWKSTELPVGWTPGEGPGGGAFPFWLSVGMLACCLTIIVRWMRGTSPLSQSTDTYMDAHALRMFTLVAGALTVMIGLIHVIGVYGAVPLFLIFYMRVLGRHRWWITGTLTVSTPIALFLFFEIALKKTLPQGYTEPLFYPLYDIFY